MIHIRRWFACMRLPSYRHLRLKLLLMLVAVVVLIIAVSILLNILPQRVRTKHRLDNDPVNWAWLLPGLNPVSKLAIVLKDHRTGVPAMDLKDQRPFVESLNCNSPHPIWDTNLRHTDRILEQLSYLPKRRRLFSSAHILVFEKGGGEVVPPGNILFKSSGCLVDNCNITLDLRTELHIDALVTSGPISSDLLQKRKPSDVYVFYQLESPLSFYSPLPLSGFNWTATYRHDSTIVTPYEKWVPFENSQSGGYFQGIDLSSDAASSSTPKNYAAGKSKMAAALISNCVGKRLKIISALSQYIQVDVYGGCGHLQCGEDCLKIFVRDYKFYLAFENANCVDYITEKFFRNALSNNILPVVFGAPVPDYIRSAPPHSYIHVDNFPTVRHLARYLRDLDKSDDLYNFYFKWKGTGSFINTKFWCRLCAMVNDLDKPRLSIPDVRTWYKDNACGDDY